eukprot:PhM_4_TR9581/c1_g1_i2/m.92456
MNTSASCIGFGYHPTAIRAALLLRISTYISNSCSTPNTHKYTLCNDTTKEVLLFCVDTTQMIVVDVADERSDFTSSNAPTCLVLEKRPGSTCVAETAWSLTTPPQHFIFTSMCYRRALDWVKQWKNVDAMQKVGITVDMRNTYLDETHIVDFLSGYSRFLSLDLSPLTNVTRIGPWFLGQCSGLTTLDLSPLANVMEIGDGFLSYCSGLSSLDLSPLTKLTKIGRSFLCDCSGL